MATYINSFHIPDDGRFGPSIIETDATPILYEGFEIYHREPRCFDVVSSGLCIGMYAGLNGAKRSIDAGRAAIAKATGGAS